MLDWSTSRAMIQTALKTGQIGTPVAVRLVVHVSADHGRIEDLAAQALEAAVLWLGGDAPDRLTAQGSLEAGQITVLARLPAGQTVLVSTGSCGIGLPLFQAAIYGNRGTLAWEDDFAPDPSLSAPGEPGGVTPRTSHAETSQLSSLATTLQARIRTALRAAQASASPGAKSLTSDAARPSATKAPFGVLLVAGDSTHQPGYAAALAADPRCRLVGLTDGPGITPRRQALNAQLAKSLGIPLLPDYAEALQRADVQIVSICAEPMRRGPLITAAAEAGKHLYLDKSLAGSLADADRVLAAARRSTAVSHMFSHVHSSAAARVRNVVRSGRLGDLVAIHLDLCFAKGYGGTAKLGQPRMENAVPEEFELTESKRELNNIGVYPIVMLLWLLGRPVRSVSAVTGNYFFEENQRNNMEDFGQMLLEVEGGLTASISVGRTGWRSHPLSGLNRVCLIGKKQCAVVDAFRPRLDVWADVAAWTPPQRDPEDPMGMWGTPTAGPYAAKPKQTWVGPPDRLAAADAAHFLDCVEQGRPSEVPVSLAAAASEILFAGYRSAASGEVVRLPLPRNS